MKKIGILGGLGPEATVDYYRTIIEFYRQRKADGSYPEMIVCSRDLAALLDMVEAGQWDEFVCWLVEGVEALRKAGADFALIAAGTPHVVFDEVSARSSLPLISVVEETCRAAEHLGLRRVGLIGTKFTMQADFFQRVFSRQGIGVVVPAQRDQDYVWDKILSELALGHVLEETRAGLLSVVDRMKARESIDGLILGCTELPLILTRDECGIPFLNTTRIHAASAVRWCLDGE